MQSADVVLAVRSDMKTGSSAREAAKAAAVPVYAIKSSAHTILVKALGKLAKLQESPPEPSGVLYQNHVVSRVRLQKREQITVYHRESCMTAGRRILSPSNHCCYQCEGTGDNVAGIYFCKQLRITINRNILLEACHVAPKAGPKRIFTYSKGRLPCIQGSTSNEAEALEEAQQALEKVVLPTRQPIELLPRTKEIILQQIDLVERSYGLATQIVGKGVQIRLRILPSIALNNVMPVGNPIAMNDSSIAL